jgi:hypothetical protein
MKIPVTMRSFAYDTRPLVETGTIGFFSDEGEPTAPSATDWNEDVLVNWLFARFQFWTLLCEVLGLSEDSHWRAGVRSPFLENTNQKPGDIDVLLVDPARPQSAVAMETKRIKIKPGRDGPQTISKLSDFGKGMIQANELWKKGFCRTYLTMLAVVDGRQATDSGFLFRGPDTDTYREVLELRNWQALRSEVGFLYVEVIQPVGRSVDESGRISVAHVHPARPKEQSADTTSRIVRFFDIGMPATVKS